MEHVIYYVCDLCSCLPFNRQSTKKAQRRKKQRIIELKRERDREHPKPYGFYVHRSSWFYVQNPKRNETIQNAVLSLVCLINDCAVEHFSVRFSFFSKMQFKFMLHSWTASIHIHISHRMFLSRWTEWKYGTFGRTEFSSFFLFFVLLDLFKQRYFRGNNGEVAREKIVASLI